MKKCYRLEEKGSYGRSLVVCESNEVDTIEVTVNTTDESSRSSSILKISRDDWEALCRETTHYGWKWSRPQDTAE